MPYVIAASPLWVPVVLSAAGVVREQLASLWAGTPVLDDATS